MPGLIFKRSSEHARRSPSSFREGGRPGPSTGLMALHSSSLPYLLTPPGTHMPHPSCQPQHLLLSQSATLSKHPEAVDRENIDSGNALPKVRSILLLMHCDQTIRATFSLQVSA